MTAIKKTLSSHSGFITIAKYDEEQHIVEGYGSSEDVDLQGGVWPPDDKDGNHPKGQTYYDGDVVSAQAIRKALPAYMEFANLREQHDEKRAVGTVLKAEVIQGVVKMGDRVLHNPLHLIAKVSDPVTWQKVKDGTLKGFSILGDVFDLEITKMFGKVVRLIKELTLTEISLVDRPANPAAQIVLWKGMTNMAKQTVVAKAADAKGAIMALQELRNEAELAGDLEKAGMYTNAIALACQANGADVEVVAEDAAEAIGEHEELGKEPPEGTPAEEAVEEGEGMSGAEPEHPTEEETAKAADELNSEDPEDKPDTAAEADKEDDKKDEVKKAASPAKVKKAAPVDTVSKAEVVALNAKVDEISKGLSGFAGDIARLVKALEDQAETIDSLKQRPVLHELPLGGQFQDGTKATAEIMKSLLAKETNPSVREALGHAITEMEIQNAEPHYMGFQR